MSDMERFDSVLRELSETQCAILAWVELAEKNGNNPIYLQFAQERLKGLNAGLKAFLCYFGLDPADHSEVFLEKPVSDYAQVYVWARDVKSLLLKLESFFNLEQIL